MQDPASPSGSNKRLLGITAVVGLLVISGAAYMVANQSQKKTASDTPSSPSPSSSVLPATTAPTVPAAGATSYQDGTYSAVGDYRSPGGPEKIQVTITLQNGAIVASAVVSQAQTPTAKSFQDMFIANYQPLVVGQPIAKLQLDRVSGSSLTPKGFNEAVEEIKAQAKAKA